MPQMQDKSQKPQGIGFKEVLSSFVLTLSFVLAAWSQDGQATAVMDTAGSPERFLAVQPQDAIRGQAVWITLAKDNPVLVRVLAIQPGIDEEANVGQDGSLQLVEIQVGKRYLFTSPRPGQYLVEAFFLEDKNGARLSVEKSCFSIYDHVPPPPQPDAVVDEQPFPSPDGLRVLIVGEAQKRATLSAEQREFFHSSEFHQYLRSITVLEKIGQDVVPGYRLWDDDYTDKELANVTDVWRAAYKAMLAMKEKKPDQEFWFLASSPKGGYKGPLPNNVREAKAILSKLVP